MKELMFTINELNSAIANITRAQARAASEIGKVIMMALYFANEKGDAGAANALMACLRKGTGKQQAIIDLLETKGNLAWMKSAKTPKFELCKGEHAKTFPTSKVEIQKLKDLCHNWESFRTDKPVEALDVEASITAILSRVAKAQKDGREIIGVEFAAGLAKLIAEYHAKEFDGK